MTDVISRGRVSAHPRLVKAFRILPLLLSAVVLAAHFYRSGSLVLAAVSLAAPAVLLTRRWWAVPALQIALFVAAAEWVRTALSISAMRELTGAPSTRMFLILGAVAAFTALSAVPLTRLTPER